MRQSDPASRQLKSADESTPKKRIAIMLDLEWPYRRHTDVYAGAHKFAQQAGDWECLLDEYADATLQQTRGKRPAYDGIIARVTPEVAAQARRFKVPVVNVWYNSPVVREFHGVFPDAAAMGRLAAEHLLERGFRRFACLSGRGDRFHQIELEHFHSVIRKAGFNCLCGQIPRQYTKDKRAWKNFRDDVDNWVATWQAPLGVFVPFPDAMGRHVADSCRRRGLVVPEDAAIVVCDNELSLCLHPAPSLTSVDIPYDQIGYAAAQTLEALMNGKKVEPLLHWITPLGIAARQSTDFFAVDDELVESALRYISANVHRPLQVDNVSAGVFVGRRTLERRFRQVLKRSVADEIVRLRVERAKRELAGTDTPIKLIATNVGFRDAKRMHEVFMRQVKLSPSEYRSNLRQS